MTLRGNSAARTLSNWQQAGKNGNHQVLGTSSKSMSLVVVHDGDETLRKKKVCGLAPARAQDQLGPRHGPATRKSSNKCWVLRASNISVYTTITLDIYSSSWRVSLPSLRFNVLKKHLRHALSTLPPSHSVPCLGIIRGACGHIHDGATSPVRVYQACHGVHHTVVEPDTSFVFDVFMIFSTPQERPTSCVGINESSTKQLLHTRLWSRGTRPSAGR